MRGDGPFSQSLSNAGRSFPPRARGWTPGSTALSEPSPVSPACAGMDPFTNSPYLSTRSFPRVRGDGPKVGTISSSVIGFPPRARGWTLAEKFRSEPKKVSPACAGMDPGSSPGTSRSCCFPRVRGDGPLR